MEGEALVAIKLLVHLRVLVGGVVVEQHVDALASWDLALDRVGEADELLMAMALHIAADVFAALNLLDGTGHPSQTLSECSRA